MNKDNNKYRLLIEGLKQEYIGRNPFATKISFCGEEPCVEENDFSDLVAGDLTIKVTCNRSLNEKYRPQIFTNHFTNRFTNSIIIHIH